MRIANSMLYRQVLDALQQQTRGQFEAQQAISSGLRFERAGEDPVAMAGVLRQQDANARLAAYASNAVVVEARLRQSELGLDALNDTLQAARETLLRGQSDALNSADRATLAAELRSAAAEVAAIANRQSEDGRPLYGGSTPQALFTGAAGAWVLNPPSAPARVAVAEGRQLDLGLDARGLFTTPGGGDLPTALEAMADQVALAPADAPGRAARAAALDAAIGELDGGLERVSAGRNRVGLDLATLDGLADSREAQRIAGEQELSRLRDADLAAEISRLAQHSASLEAARAVFQRLESQSLFNYLR